MFNGISPTGVPSLYQVMTGLGLPVTSHTKLVGWLRTTDMLPGVSLSRNSGGTVEASKVIMTYNVSIEVHWCVGKWLDEQVNHRWLWAGISSPWIQRHWRQHRHTLRCPAVTQRPESAVSHPPGWRHQARSRSVPGHYATTESLAWEGLEERWRRGK